MSWPMVKIGSCIEKVKSWNPLKSADTDSFLYIDLSSVDKDKKELDQNSVVSILPSEAPSRARQLVRANDVLVSTVRPNLNGVALVTDNYCGATASTGYCVLRANAQKLDSRFLFYWVQTQSFISDMVKKATGANYPAVSDKIIMDSEIPLPPLAEQKRIAAILDKADAIRRKRQQAIQLADDFLRAVFLEMFGDPVTNPKNLRVVPLADLCNKITDGTHQSPRWENSGVPFLFISNIANGKINYATNKFISKDTFAELTRTTPIEKDDILYTTVGSYGNVALVPGDKEFCFQRHIAHIKPNHQKIKPRFLAGMLESSVIKRQADALVRGVAQKTLNLRELKEIRVFDILGNEQKKYLNIITPVRRTKDNFERSEAQLEIFFRALSQKAFSGQL